MRLRIRAAGVASAVMLGAGALTLAGAPASAAPTHCYPPSACHIGFNHSTYHPGGKVKFDTGNAFGRHEHVTGTLRCKHHFVRHTRTFKAGLHGRVKTSFHVPAHAPDGTCKFILLGKRGGEKITNTFQVTG